MADRIGKARRSWNMSRIRATNTKPERLVRSLVHSMGYRFRLHRKDLPGRPDLVFPKYRAVIFVHGCFWHRHGGCKYAYTPKSRRDFWLRKFEANTARDRSVVRQLKSSGWKAMVVWECELDSPERVMRRVRRFLEGRGS